MKMSDNDSRVLREFEIFERQLDSTSTSILGMPAAFVMIALSVCVTASCALQLGAAVILGSALALIACFAYGVLMVNASRDQAIPESAQAQLLNSISALGLLTDGAQGKSLTFADAYRLIREAQALITARSCLGTKGQGMSPVGVRFG